jgi:hypothetical protein
MLKVPFTTYFQKRSEEIILEQKENVITHLTHLEELILTKKQDGLNLAILFLRELYNTLHGNASSKTFVGVKYDGCIHPETKIVTDQGSVTIHKIIEDFQAGEKILVRGFDFNQNTEVLANVSCAHSSAGLKQWVEIELENGDFFRCTEDHEVYTENRGWIQAKDLTVHDTLKYSP